MTNHRHRLHHPPPAFHHPVVSCQVTHAMCEDGQLGTGALVTHVVRNRLLLTRTVTPGAVFGAGCHHYLTKVPQQHQGLRCGSCYQLLAIPLDSKKPLRSVGEPANIVGGLASGLKGDKRCVTKLKDVSVSAVLVSTTWLLDSHHDNTMSSGYMLRYVTYNIKKTHVNT